MQTTSHLLMIRPVNFSFNPETAVNNAFQVEPGSVAGDGDDDGSQIGPAAVQRNALREFEDFVALLRENNIDLTVINDSPLPYTPDSIFPNNWISFHADGQVCLYPMFAPNRRLERKPEVVQELGRRFEIRQTVDLSKYEQAGHFLEGTGSMVLDRENKIAYACLSPRTDQEVLRDFCHRMGYSPEVFSATDDRGRPVYHTNVMMCVADKYVVICLESLPDPKERQRVQTRIQGSGKEIVDISLAQMDHFAGNMLQVESISGEKLLIMSAQAYHSLDGPWIRRLTSFNRIIHSPLTTIETNGGGSARCMLAEVHLPLRQPGNLK
jgi:hypothetical protein